TSCDRRGGLARAPQADAGRRQRGFGMALLCPQRHVHEAAQHPSVLLQTGAQAGRASGHPVSRSEAHGRYPAPLRRGAPENRPGAPWTRQYLDDPGHVLSRAADAATRSRGQARHAAQADWNVGEWPKGYNVATLTGLATLRTKRKLLQGNAFMNQ